MYPYVSIVLLCLVLVSNISAYEIQQITDPLTKAKTQENSPNSYEEYNRQIHAMIDAYKSDMDVGDLVLGMKKLIDTKYITWKRNGDLINSLLSLPKGMYAAGR